MDRPGTDADRHHLPRREKKLELRAQEPPAGRAATTFLNQFYTEVIEAIRDAEAILIFGPGEAKTELRQHLERARLGSKVIGVETADKMTDPEIAAKVREHFQSVQVPGTPASTRKVDTPSRSKAGGPLSSPSHSEQRS